VNYLDFAAVSVPIGLDAQGLPVGLQIVVRPFDDALALRIARAVEIVTGGFKSPRM
jgi:Asp-tRNA(Asn)/Glu-tRNA(Gln) amidotransferase A subunit family amidase